MRRFASLLFLSLVLTVPLAQGQNPRSAEEYSNRGLDRQNKGDLDGAIADYSKAIELKPSKKLELATIYYNRGNARLNKNDPDGAIADYTKAIELDPASAQAYVNRGVVRLLLGRDAEADQDFEKGFQLDGSLRASLEKFISETKRQRRKGKP